MNHQSPATPGNRIRWRGLLPAIIVGLSVTSVNLVGLSTSASAAPTAVPSAAVAKKPSTPKATSVAAFGAPTGGDDTSAFLAAQDAALASTFRFAQGPGGAPQAVVSVPPGTYKLLRLPFRSNIRMEVSAGAVLQQAGGRNVDVGPGAPALIVWDGPQGAELANVTLTGVNSSTGGLKALANPVFVGWSLKSSFTFNLDPATTDANTLVTGVQALNVRGFLIQNVYSIENDSQPAVAPTTDDGWWPQSRKAALGLRERADTPANGSVFYDPRHGSVVNWYNIHAPKGFGPDQVNAAHDVSFSHIFSSGGTTMRFETDASQGKTFASEIRGVTADDIAGRDCNRTVAFAPHAQNNYDVHVTHVQSVGCAQGVAESVDLNAFPQGSFANSTIAGVTVKAGPKAQLALPGTNGMWAVGPSDRAFAKDAISQIMWSVIYAPGTYSCSGAFSFPSDLIMTTIGLLSAVCI